MRNIRRLIAAAVTALACAHARADFYLVVSADSAEYSLTQKQAVDLYMGRRRAFPNGDTARVFDMGRQTKSDEAFYLALTGLSQAQVNSYWSRLQFSGRNLPPESLPSEAAMVNMIRSNPGAIGWLSQEPSDPRLRTLLVIKDPR